ncbi:leucine-rich repeat protein kinase family protein [Actinidia rufa]|uniref:Leucine-rich repeat protein kinase family protein n=1 Tax=Actinidia rufa TaxID=165716 RepID=A0A7J0FTP3_9ERIC|nr:leucine-rich repeat protein kinase family protein [Actinidia rufa]
MSHNSLTGMLPPEVGNLKVLVILDVSYNKLSGEIPSTLGRCEVPRGGVFCNASAAEVYSNIKICGGISELRLHRCPMQGPEKPGKHTTLKQQHNLVNILTSCSSVDLAGNEFKALMWLLHLHYLHNQCESPTVHGDLKPSIVLLGKVLTAHVSDFSLARLLSISSKHISGQFSSIRVKRTTGYAAPEYGVGEQTSTCGDVYSFAILLLEMFTGRTPTNELFKDDLNLHNFAKLTLPGRVNKLFAE